MEAGRAENLDPDSESLPLGAHAGPAHHTETGMPAQGVLSTDPGLAGARHRAGGSQALVRHLLGQATAAGATCKAGLSGCTFC